MSNSNSIRAAIVVIIAFALAIWLGVSIVTNQSETVLQIAGSALLIACIFLGRKIWLLLIFFAALDVTLIRGFSTTELGQFLFVGFTIAMTLMRRQPYRLSLGEKEIWMLLLAACIVQVYMRNPVGLNMFGAGAVGARPYFMVAMAFFASAFLGNIVVRATEIKLAFKLMIAGSILSIFANSFRMRIGGGSAVSEGFQGGNMMDDGGGAGRNSSLGNLGGIVAKMVVTFKSPLQVLIHPVWGSLIAFSLIAAGLSGFRNSVAYVGMIYLIGIAYRGGGIQVLISCISGALLLGVIAIVNTISPLPPAIQRGLSPFPGTWEERYVEAGEESTEWRVEMWKEALFTEYWINNKLLGDGLGMTRRELELVQDMKTGGGGKSEDIRGSGLSKQQEAMMVTGGYHSGPVQTVRAVGYVGLVVLVLALWRMAVHAHRQIQRCRGTEWYPVSLFIGIPIVISPPFFVFIVGDFGTGAASLCASYGLLNLLEKNLPIPVYVKRRYQPYILNSNSK